MNPILKRTLTGLSIGAAVIAAIVFSPVGVFLPVCAAIYLFAIAEYFSLLSKKSLPKRFDFLLRLLGLPVIGFGLFSLPDIAKEYGNLMLLWTIAIIKFSDVGGFAFGLTSAKLMKGGNHKLCPKISPGKSWEGLLGSLICSSLVSLAFMSVTHFTVVKSVMMGVVAALVGTAGDLIESKFKRWVGVKDSSTWKITNGMGGVLDMIDSLLIAPLIIYVLI